jgi:dihydrodipicolinate synthase/N-acetylneuraminate lyase
MTTKHLKGIIPPTTTPFNDLGDIDLGAFKAQIEFMISMSVRGVCVGSSTGEGHTLEAGELAALWSNSKLVVSLLNRIMREVPGGVGVKQSKCDLKIMADLLLDLPFGKLVHSAIPVCCVKLWNAMQQKDFATAEYLHWGMLQLWNTIAGDNLPASVKYVQALQGVPSGLPSRPMRMPSDAQCAKIKVAFDRLMVLM